MKKKKGKVEIEEMIQDSFNLPRFREDSDGYIMSSFSNTILILIKIIIIVIGFAFIYRLYNIQIAAGDQYHTISMENTFSYLPVFQERGIIFDRYENRLSWNETDEESEIGTFRNFGDYDGVAHTVGYVLHPKKDKNGFYFRDSMVGVSGAEALFNNRLNGRTGAHIIEKDATGEVISNHTIVTPINGKSVHLSIDAELSDSIYGFLKDTVDTRDFIGGSVLVMDISNGELLSVVNYPEYSPSVLSRGEDEEAINQYINDERFLFLNRAISGKYTPASTIKPFVGIGILEEGVIDPKKEIYAAESISIPHPYDKERVSKFYDWKEHGLVDFDKAIALSSNIYFYQTGGGYQDQEGIGINAIDRYLKLFKFDDPTLTQLSLEPEGTIPNPRWKKENFNDAWRVGDTYNTVIGQYGFHITPLQMIRALSGIASNGTIVEPTILKGDDTKTYPLPFSDNTLETVREAMRSAVSFGTAKGLNISSVDIGAKTGTAQIGGISSRVNSWSIGFFPYDNPRYAFTVLLERGPEDNLIGGVFVARQMMDWIVENRKEMIQI